MATVAPRRRVAPSASSSATPPIRRITVEEYERIVESSALESPEQIELIDGYLVERLAKEPGHSYAATETYQALLSRLPSGWSARKEEPVRIPEFDEPEPDISVVRGTNADYRNRVPGPADVALLVEVSESTLAQDRGPKLSAYARAKVPVYWIINLVDRQVEVYTRPLKTGRYRTRTDYKPGQSIPVVIDGQERLPIEVDAILP